MKKYKFEDIDFEIVYDEKCIYAESLDPEIDENIIIIEGLYEGNEYVFSEASIKLFNNYTLTNEKFNEIKNFIKKEKAL